MGSKQINYHIMSSSFFLLCCLLTLSLYSISQHTSYSLDFKPTRKLGMSGSVQDHGYHETQQKMQVVDKAMENSTAIEDFTKLEYTGYGYNPNDLVYHTDYHGVTTHPTPKHPKP